MAAPVKRNATHDPSIRDVRTLRSWLMPYWRPRTKASQPSAAWAIGSTATSIERSTRPSAPGPSTKPRITYSVPAGRPPRTALLPTTKLPA